MVQTTRQRSLYAEQNDGLTPRPRLPNVPVRSGRTLVRAKD